MACCFDGGVARFKCQLHITIQRSFDTICKGSKSRVVRHVGWKKVAKGIIIWAYDKVGKSVIHPPYSTMER